MDVFEVKDQAMDALDQIEKRYTVNHDYTTDTMS